MEGSLRICLWFLLHFMVASKSTGSKGLNRLEPDSIYKLQEYVGYKCDGEIKFEISINVTSGPANLRDVHMLVCQSSWSNRWCTSPNSFFVEQPCRNEVWRSTNTTQACILDIGTMCKAIHINSVYRNWFHSVYVVRVNGIANGKVYSTEKIALSPMRYQMQCGNGLQLGMRIRGYCKQCNVQNYI